MLNCIHRHPIDGLSSEGSPDAVKRNPGTQVNTHRITKGLAKGLDEVLIHTVFWPRVIVDGLEAAFVVVQFIIEPAG